MKKITKLLALSLALLGIAFTGCKNDLGDATITGEGLEGAKTLTIFATGEDTVITFPEESARSITPAALDGTALTFKLTAVNTITGATDINDQTVDFVANTGSTTEGVVNVTINVSSYKLTLDAYSGAKKVLTAVAYADLRYNETVNFFLMPVSSGSGSVSLKLYTDGWNLTTYPNYEAKAYITKSLTDDTVYNSDFVKLFANNALPDNSNIPTTANFPTTNGKSLSTGTYNFVVEFTSTKDGKTFYWSDRIVILPDQVTEATIGIPLVIGTKPAAPSDLIVGYKTPTTDDSLYYQARFDWTDNANNEQYFRLELCDISGTLLEGTPVSGVSPEDFTNISKVTAFADAATAKAGWDALNPSTGSTSKIYILDNTVYSLYDTDKEIDIVMNSDTTGIADGITYSKDGSDDNGLTKNNKHLVLNLPLGRRYLARMCTVNAAGLSDYTYAVINPTTYNVTGYTKWPDDAVAINVFKITYNLVGGKFYEAEQDGTQKSKVTKKLSGAPAVPTDKTAKIPNINTKGDKIIVYDTQSTDNTNDCFLINPLDVTTTDSITTALFNGANKWASWKLNSTSESANFRKETDWDKPLVTYNSKYSSSAWQEKGFENLDLYAAYASATAKIYNPADYKVTKDDVILYKSDNATYSVGNCRSFDNGSTINIKEYTYKAVGSEPGDWASKYNTNYYEKVGSIYKNFVGVSTYSNATQYWKKSAGGDYTPYTLGATEPADYGTDYYTGVSATLGVAENWADKTTWYSRTGAAAPFTYTVVSTEPSPFDPTQYYHTVTATQVTATKAAPAFNSSNCYEVDSANSEDNTYIYILVKNEDKYSDVQLQLATTTGTPVGTYKKAASSTTHDVYTVTTSKPADYQGNESAYYKWDTGTSAYVAATGSDNWAPDTIYVKSTPVFEVFSIPTTSLAATSFQATIKAYAGITTDSPYTYPVIFTITE